MTATPVTSAAATVPAPCATVQTCRLGSVLTVTAYSPPAAIGVANVNDPLLATVRSSPPLSCKTTVPDSPETVPPTVYVVSSGVCGVGGVWIVNVLGALTPMSPALLDCCARAV